MSVKSASLQPLGHMAQNLPLLSVQAIVLTHTWHLKAVQPLTPVAVEKALITLALTTSFNR